MRRISLAALEPRYDCVFFGTSAISLFEAIHQRAQGRRVLMVDDQPRVGGVWVTLDMFGLHDVENAIHYFLYDADGIAFMRQVLRWNVVSTPAKYRVLPGRFLGRRWLPYDSVLGIVAARWFQARADAPGQRLGFVAALRTLASAASEALRRRGGSHYLAGGTPEMMRGIDALYARHDIDVLLGTEITQLHVDVAGKEAIVGMGDARCRADTVFVTSGSRLRSATSDEGPIAPEEEVLRRPQIHLLVEDAAPAVALEAIFVADDLIKYVHDISRFTREAAELAGRRKLLCIATTPDVRESASLYDKVLARLKEAGILGATAALLGKQWYESYLPALNTDQLDILQRRFAPVMQVLKTDNFCQALGLYGPRWADSLSRQPH
jgi:hypothetical protein